VKIGSRGTERLYLVGVNEHVGFPEASEAILLSETRLRAGLSMVMTHCMPTEQDGKKRRVMIVDDHPVVCEGIVQAIAREPDLEVAGVVTDIAAAMALVKEDPPDAAIVDLGLGSEDGLELVHRLVAERPGIAIVAFSMYDELLYAERALKAGARGYVMKDVSITTLLEAVRRAIAGNVTVGEKVTTKILSLFGSGREAHGQSEVSKLSDRELAIFRLIGGGLTTREIAERVGLSIKTVESHRLHIKKKLGLESANKLVVHAAAWVLDEG